ncbi:MAG: hypothetical protein D6826_10710 [Alphaproteobacteria bacterium]|nr:MAG: hypothetical protein D6826_10710 [Alphaproteobacteria bacterium]
MEPVPLAPLTRTHGPGMTAASMHRGVPSIVVAGLAGMVCLIRPEATAAQGEPEPWHYQCLGSESMSGDDICTTETTVQTDAYELLVYFVHSPNGQKPLVVAVDDVPLREVRIAVDKKAPIATTQCEEDACFFAAKDSRTLLIRFRRGRRARIEVIPDGESAAPLEFEVSLRGFTAALTDPGF